MHLNMRKRLSSLVRSNDDGGTNNNSNDPKDLVVTTRFTTTITQEQQHQKTKTTQQQSYHNNWWKFICLLRFCVVVVSVVVLLFVMNSSRQRRKLPSSKLLTTPAAVSIHDDHKNPAVLILKAYVEPIRFADWWDIKPLPIRRTTTATSKKDQLLEISYPRITSNSCNSNHQLTTINFPVDDYPDQDPFLPWIHDVFLTDDGKFIQFVAQNKRRCHTGTTHAAKEILLKTTQPSIALFQHVPIKRILLQAGGETRYQLATSHTEADPDGIATRFICRFKPTWEETLSIFNFDYDWISYRNKRKYTFHPLDESIKSIHTSQLLFKCPIPKGLQTIIMRSSGRQHNVNLNSGLSSRLFFVDVIPIRTPPRYGIPNEFLQPRYNESLPANMEDRFDPKTEWSDHHILPKIEDSGRWENIPICIGHDDPFSSKKDLDDNNNNSAAVSAASKMTTYSPPKKKKKHKLTVCVFASSMYYTRGNRYQVTDGKRRLLEWILYNKMIGVEHFYLYDNSLANNDIANNNANDTDATLKSIADLFPKELVTYISWPYKICNNNPNNVDSPGEKSSLYAAISSCHLRFGSQTEWMAQLDIDEYIIPTRNQTSSIIPLLDKLEREDKKIVSFGSWRSLPRRDFLDTPVLIQDKQQCGGKSEPCFELRVASNFTILQGYNCDRSPRGRGRNKSVVMPAEKQIYKPEYVLQQFVHYTSVTATTVLNRSEFEAAGYDWSATRVFPDPKWRFVDEENEAFLLHSKAVARQDTAGWQQACLDGYKGRFPCRIGVPFPIGHDADDDGGGGKPQDTGADEKGWAYNCYANRRIDEFWAPKLEAAIREHMGKAFE